MKDYELHTFANGIRLVHKQVAHTRIAHLGFLLDVGSRDETLPQQGLAHFWEHMAFKGTTHHKSYYIITAIDKVGGELNAYTTKEKVCFHVSVLDRYYERALALLTDIAFDSVFPEKEIEKERAVILEEMAMYEDAPDDAIQDEFDEVVFGQHPLGRNILGTEASVNSFQRQDFLAFIRANVNTSRVVLSSVGNFPMKKAIALAERYLKDIPAQNGQIIRQPFATYSPQRREQRKPISQAHCLLGRDAYAIGHERRLQLFMLTNLLGGPFMNSRLNLSLREKHGLVYGIEANYTPYLDTGLFSIYFATDPQRLPRARQLVHRELLRLCDTPLGKTQLLILKEQLKGQLAMSEESNSGLMQMLGKSLLDLGYIESLTNIYERIDATTALDLSDIANELLRPEMLCELAYLPVEEE